MLSIILVKVCASLVINGCLLSSCKWRFSDVKFTIKNSCDKFLVSQVCSPRSIGSISPLSDHFVFPQALDEFVRKTFNEWTSTVDKEATRLLEIPLMRRSLDRSGTLDLNFDRLILLLWDIYCRFHSSSCSYKSLFLDEDLILILLVELVLVHVLSPFTVNAFSDKSLPPSPVL